MVHSSRCLDDPLPEPTHIPPVSVDSSPPPARTSLDPAAPLPDCSYCSTCRRGQDPESLPVPPSLFDPSSPPRHIVSMSRAYHPPIQYCCPHLSVLLVSYMILVPVIVLHFVKNSDARLGIIVGFTVAFSLVLASATEAKRREVFAATAAVVAVQVVYISSALSPVDQRQ